MYHYSQLPSDVLAEWQSSAQQRAPLGGPGSWGEDQFAAADAYGADDPIEIDEVEVIDATSGADIQAAVEALKQQALQTLDTDGDDRVSRAEMKAFGFGLLAGVVAMKVLR